jgi:hypothetical protein
MYGAWQKYAIPITASVYIAWMEAWTKHAIIEGNKSKQEPEGVKFKQMFLRRYTYGASKSRPEIFICLFGCSHILFHPSVPSVCPGREEGPQAYLLSILPDYSSSREMRPFLSAPFVEKYAILLLIK